METKETEKHEAHQSAPLEKAQSNLVAGIVVGDFREQAYKVADASLSLIVTDPPYNLQSSDLFEALGKFAAPKLADGGSLLCYVNHLKLRDALNSLSNHLNFWWPCVRVHYGPRTLMPQYGVRVGSQLILWFVKGTRGNRKIIVLDTVAGGPERDSPDWRQSEEMARYFIEDLCPRDGTVCDPFLGSGSTAVAAMKLNRKWIGFEIDPQTAAIANGRILSQK